MYVQIDPEPVKDMVANVLLALLFAILGFGLLYGLTYAALLLYAHLTDWQVADSELRRQTLVFALPPAIIVAIILIIVFVT